MNFLRRGTAGVARRVEFVPAIHGTSVSRITTTNNAVLCDLHVQVSDEWGNEVQLPQRSPELVLKCPLAFDPDRVRIIHRAVVRHCVWVSRFWFAYLVGRLPVCLVPKYQSQCAVSTHLRCIN